VRRTAQEGEIAKAVKFGVSGEHERGRQILYA